MSIEKDIKIYVSGVLGEASLANSFEEMAAIAAVLFRQKNCRGFSTWSDFSVKDKSFAYGFDTTKNQRALLVINANDVDFEGDGAVAIAYKAVQHVLGGGRDYSNGAFFWDGNDLKTNYKNHAKVKAGIVFVDSAHNVFGVDESKKVYERYCVTVKDGKKEKTKVSTDHVYESTAAYVGSYNKTKYVENKNSKGKVVKNKIQVEIKTGTVFWRMNPDYVKYFNGGRDFK